MQRLPAKQVNKVIGAKIKSSTYTNTAASSDTVTSIINAQLTALGLTNQNSADVDTEGVDNNFLCEIFYDAEKVPFVALNGSQVFGLLSKSGSVWTIAYKYYNYATSTWGNYTFLGTNSLYFEYSYRTQLKDFYLNLVEKYNPPAKKIIKPVNNEQNITIDYNSKIFGQLPNIMFWDTATLQMEICQAQLDSITNPTQISIDFGENKTGYVVVT